MAAHGDGSVGGLVVDSAGIVGAARLGGLLFVVNTGQRWSRV